MTEIDPKACYPVMGSELIELRRLALSLQPEKSTARMFRVADFGLGLVAGLCLAALLLT